MESLSNFLTFKTFITPNILIGMYYFGVVLVPIFSWLLVRWLTNKFELLKSVQQLAKQSLTERFKQLSFQNQLLIIGLGLSVFLIMQLVWRMMFEAMLAYFQMRDYLQTLSQPIS